STAASLSWSCSPDRAPFDRRFLPPEKPQYAPAPGGACCYSHPPRCVKRGRLDPRECIPRGGRRSWNVGFDDAPTLTLVQTPRSDYGGLRSTCTLTPLNCESAGPEFCRFRFLSDPKPCIAQHACFRSFCSGLARFARPWFGRKPRPTSRQNRPKRGRWWK